jgi:hypothetical protein
MGALPDIKKTLAQTKLKKSHLALSAKLDVWTGVPCDIWRTVQ